jgi:hypothetical protein
MKSLKEPFDIDIPLKSSPLTVEELSMVRAYIAISKQRNVVVDKHLLESAAAKPNPEVGK